MPNDKLFIADRIKVGFQERSDTYTKRLGYVIYYDKQGVLRKEKSWNSWRDSKIDPVEFDNVPTEGFVLNRNGGGVRQSYGWNARCEFVRVWDPRDFEFEISIGNLLYILKECDCSRGKGLEGKFVYAWDKTSLVLLPVGSAEYKECVQFTELQDKKVKAKELIPGASYKTRDNRLLTYLGKFERFLLTDGYREKKYSKPYVFWTGERYEYHKNVSQIAALHSDVVIDDYADLVDRYMKGPCGSKPVGLKLKQSRSKPKADGWNYWFVEETPGVYTEVNGYGITPESVGRIYRYKMAEDGVRAVYSRSEECLYSTAYCEGRAKAYRENYRQRHLKPPTPSQIADDGPQQNELHAILESGSSFLVSHGSLKGT